MYIYFLVTFGSKGLSHPPRNITTTAAITSPMVQFSPYSSCCSCQEQNVYRVHIKTSTKLLQVNNVTILVKYLQITVNCKYTPFEKRVLEKLKWWNGSISALFATCVACYDHNRIKSYMQFCLDRIPFSNCWYTSGVFLRNGKLWWQKTLWLPSKYLWYSRNYQN